jgi:Flp pilus assembly protein TadD
VPPAVKLLSRVWRPGLALLCILAWAAALCADPGSCAECHGQIAKDYGRTGMAKSFRKVRADTELPQFAGEYDHQVSREHFVALRRGNRYYIRRQQTGTDGKPANVREVSVDYVLGSGNGWISYVHRTQNANLLELPVSWYSENGGHWGISPGYDRPDHAGFSRQIFSRCLFCHNGYPARASSREVDPSGDDEATIFPSDLPEGIDCQRCHGTGAEHMAAARQGKPIAAIKAAIVNPARLSPERQLEVCMQCHLETTQSPLPSSIRRFDRSVFSYRPGEPLENYIVYFDQAAASGHGDKFELISAAYRMRKSICFTRSGGQMTCIGCHDPHRALSRGEAEQKANRYCNACHQGRIASLTQLGRHTARQDCAGCHMPQRQPTTAIHITITDHLIQRPAVTPAAPVLAEENDSNTVPYTGKVEPYYPNRPDPIYLALAQVKDLANMTDGLALLEKLLAGPRLKYAEPYFLYGEALLQTGQSVEAANMYRRAVLLEPSNWRFEYALGQALQAAGKLDRALDAFERAIRLAPDETKPMYGLGAAYEALGRLQEATRVYREIGVRNPEDASAFNNLSLDLGKAGDTSGANRALREAIRLEPERSAFHINLAGLLMKEGKTNEARDELQWAVLYGPSTPAGADLMLGSLLLAEGHVDQARVLLNQAMQSRDPRIRTAAARALARGGR